MVHVRAWRWSGLLLLLLSPALLFHDPASANPVLVVEAGNATLTGGQTSGFIPVYLLNTQDSVAAFELLITASDPAAVEFLEALDTAGTLISGWQFNLVTAIPGGIHMIWLPNQIGHTTIPSISPSTQTRTLVKLPFLLHGLNPAGDYTFDVTIDTSLADFGFSNPFGYLIGVHTDTIVDTACFQCNGWNGTECLEWIKVTEPPCDSTAIDSFPHTFIDTSKTWVFNGTINVISCCRGNRGNVNNDPADQVDLSDLSALITHLVAGGASPACRLEADINASGNVDLSDLTLLISYLLIGGPLPSCT